MQLAADDHSAAQTLAALARSSRSSQADRRTVFRVGANASDLAAMKQEMVRTMSVEPNEEIGASGTRFLGPIRIRKLPTPAVGEDSVIWYNFQFVVKDGAEPLDFLYSTADDLVGAI